MISRSDQSEGPSGVRLRDDVVEQRRGWMELREAWNRLAEQSPFDSPMLRHEFLTAFLDNFAPEARLHVATVRRSGELSGAAALAWRLGSYRGLPYRALVSLSNVHSARFDILAADDGAIESLWRGMADLPGWDVLELHDVPQGGRAERLVELAQRDGHPTGRWESMRTPYVPLGPGGPAPNAKLRQNLRRRRRRLEEFGTPRFVEVTGGAFDAFLERGFELEASGWKGRRGSAMACHPATRGFYRELAREAAGQGWLALAGLLAGDRLAAFQFGLRMGRRHYLPKPAYDETLAACSPGQLLMEDVLGSCRARGLEEFDFLGPSMPWKRDWTPHERPHGWYFVHRPTPLGRALWSARFRLAPAARQGLSALKRSLPWRQ